MKTADYAIDFVYATIKGQTGVPSQVYKVEKPTNMAGTSYVVINSLPVNAGILQFVHVNVNYHVQDLAPGIPDLNTIKTGTAVLMGLLEKVDSQANGIYIDFEQHAIYREEQLNEHFSNIRLFIKILN